MKISGTLALAGGLLVAAFAAPAMAQNNAVKFGVLLPLSGPGAIAGASAVAGTNLAAKEVNQAGGILGRQIVVIPADDQGDPTRGVSEARRLAQQEKVSFVFGSLASPITLAALPIFTEARILQLSGSGAPELTPERGPYHFSVSADAVAQGEAMVDYALNGAKAKRVAIITDKNPNFLGVVEIMKRNATARGATIVGTEEYEMRQTDMSAQALSLRRLNPDLLIVVGVLPEDTANVIKATNEIGWKVPIAIGMGAGATAQAMLKVVPANEMPAGLVGQNYLSMTYCPSDPVGQSAVPVVLGKLKAELPDYDRYLGTSLVFGYDAVYIAKQVFEAVKSFDGEAAAKWIEANSARIDAAFNKYSGTKERHFLVGANSVTMTEKPWERRADGLSKRVGC